MQLHPHPPRFTRGDHITKSLSEWVCNIADGGPYLSFGYFAPCDVTIHPLDEKAFLEALEMAENQKDLCPGGNRAILFCTTTDPYQILRHSDPKQEMLLNTHMRTVTRRMLTLIRDHSTLRVRILTRSPLAQEDFDLFKSFGNRLLFGMYLPTLRNDLYSIYERDAPSPASRLETLKKAKAAGLHVFVAMAPTFPESDEADLRRTMEAIAELDPLTVFHEILHLNADGVARIVINAAMHGARVNTKVFRSRKQWIKHALQTFASVERIADTTGLRKRLHLWPHQALETNEATPFISSPARYWKWLERCWMRVSEWP